MWNALTHWGQVTPYGFIDIGWDCFNNGMVHAWHQAIALTSYELLPIGRFINNFGAVWINTQQFSLKKMYLKKCRLQNGDHVVPASMS